MPQAASRWLQTCNAWVAIWKKRGRATAAWFSIKGQVTFLGNRCSVKFPIETSNQDYSYRVSNIEWFPRTHYFWQDCQDSLQKHLDNAQVGSKLQCHAVSNEIRCHEKGNVRKKVIMLAEQRIGRFCKCCEFALKDWEMFPVDCGCRHKSILPVDQWWQCSDCSFIFCIFFSAHHVVLFSNITSGPLRFAETLSLCLPNLHTSPTAWNCSTAQFAGRGVATLAGITCQNGFKMVEKLRFSKHWLAYVCWVGHGKILHDLMIWLRGYRWTIFCQTQSTTPGAGDLGVRISAPSIDESARTGLPWGNAYGLRAKDTAIVMQLVQSSKLVWMCRLELKRLLLVACVNDHLVVCLEM